MCSRRNKPVLQVIVFFGLVASLGYSVYLYNTITLKLDRSERQINKYAKHQKSLSSQLQVVYEHRARLEKSFENEKADHKKTKTDLEDSKRNFFVNITRTRHETLNRFNSLETQHRMVKAKHEQLQVEYNRLQQQHARLSAEHVSVHNQQVSSFNAMRNQKDNEVLGLEAQVNTLKKQVGTWKRQYGTEHKEVDYYKGLNERALQEVEKYKGTILKLYDKIKNSKLKAVIGTVLNNKQLPILNELVGDNQNPETHAHRLGNADTRPGRIPVPKATRRTEQVREGVNTVTRRNDENDEEEPDENANTRKISAPSTERIQQETEPPSYVPPEPVSDGDRPDILRQQRNREQETEDKSRDSPDAPVILRDHRSTQDSVAVSLASPSRHVHQVGPKPVTIRRDDSVRRAVVGESEGDFKADNEGGPESEEQKVKRYLSRNAGNVDDSRLQLLQEQLRQQQQLEQKQQQQKHQEQLQPRQQEQQQQQHPQQGQRQEQQSDGRSDRQDRSVHKNAEQPHNYQENDNQEQKPVLNRLQQNKQLNKQNSHEGLSKLAKKDSSRETNGENSRQDRLNDEKKRLKREEQFRRPIPRPGGGDERKKVESVDRQDNQNKNKNVPEEENDEDEDGNDEERDEKDNAIDQANNQGIPRPDANKPPNSPDNTEEVDEQGNERQQRPNRGARLRGFRQAR